YSPETCEELEQCLDELRDHPGPAYLRLANRKVLKSAPGFRAGGPAVVALEPAGGPGASTLVLSSGPRTTELRSRAARLKELGIAHLHLARVQPFPAAELEPWLAGAGRVL